MNAPWKFRTHTFYKQLCAAASVGDLSALDSEKLSRHLKSCADCRELCLEFADINAALLPETSNDEETIAGLEASTQTAVLESVAAYREKEAPQLLGCVPARSNPQLHAPKVGFGMRHSPVWSAAVIAIAVVCFALGTRYQSFRVTHTRRSDAASSANLKKSELHSSRRSASNPIEGIQAQLEQAERIQSQLRDDLQAEEQREIALKGAFVAHDQQLATAHDENAALRKQIAAYEQEIANTRAMLATKSAEVEQAELSTNADKATIVELKYKLQELAERTNLEAADLQRERDLLSKGREIRDIVGARNLHIVDVYDADAKGHTKRPFARAFYTEGKSLVFYAYDLPIQRADEQLSYVAWGQKNGKKSSTKNLGILVNDDQGQRRWSLNFSDPHILAEIDSVFITLEPTRDAGQPSGKRMLTAYLNDAVNHP